MPTETLKRVEILSLGGTGRQRFVNYCCQRLQVLFHQFVPGESQGGLKEKVQEAVAQLDRSLMSVRNESPNKFCLRAALEVRQGLMKLIEYAILCGKLPLNHNELSHSSTLPQSKSTHSIKNWNYLHTEIGNFPRDEQDIFGLLWYLELSKDEAAIILNITAHSVKCRWQSARLRLASVTAALSHRETASHDALGVETVEAPKLVKNINAPGVRCQYCLGRGVVAMEIYDDVEVGMLKCACCGGEEDEIVRVIGKKKAISRHLSKIPSQETLPVIICTSPFEIAYSDRLNVFRNPHDDEYASRSVRAAIDTAFSRFRKDSASSMPGTIEECLQQNSDHKTIESESYSPSHADEINLKLYFRMQQRLWRIADQNRWEWAKVLDTYGYLIISTAAVILRNAVTPNREYFKLMRNQSSSFPARKVD